MAYKVIILYQLYMPSYFLGTFTEYPSLISIEDALIGKTEGLTPIRNVVPLIYFLSLTENLRWS